ncbi:hypothetical protein F2Q69_00016152 [Brassica cretica]|uniref:Uncharacterized protein n=1 Tax=Brassica cretica TaxID=69181 RepID=A0A8S9QQ42_BRACR|nr:hypothetical protein F2Q69_00016152 [Brassica cretica]
MESCVYCRQRRFTLPPYLHRYYDIDYLVHFLDKKNTFVVMCMECIGEKNEDSDDENDEGIPQIRL